MKDKKSKYNSSKKLSLVLKNIKDNRKARNIILTALVVLSISIFVLFLYKIGFNYKSNIYYRTYTKENGWSRWVKNGKTSGNGKDSILNIQLKVKTKGDNLYYAFYQAPDTWVTNRDKSDEKIYGFKANLKNALKENYSIYYRTYNNKNKWFEWSTDEVINGNKKVPITKIEIKILKNNTSLDDHLEDYRIREIQSIGFEKVGDIDE